MVEHFSRLFPEIIRNSSFHNLLGFKSPKSIPCSLYILQCATNLIDLIANLLAAASNSHYFSGHLITGYLSELLSIYLTVEDLPTNHSTAVLVWASTLVLFREEMLTLDAVAQFALRLWFNWTAFALPTGLSNTQCCWLSFSLEQIYQITQKRFCVSSQFDENTKWANKNAIGVSYLNEALNLNIIIWRINFFLSFTITPCFEPHQKNTPPTVIWNQTNSM